MNSSLTGLLLAAGLVLSPAAARADKFELLPPGSVPASEEHYGFTILALDGGAFLLPFFASSIGDDWGEGSVNVSIGVYLLGGPIVHAAHGEGKRALASLGLRAGLPIAGAFGLALVSNCDEDEDPFCDLASIAVGGAMGMAAAMILDWTVLSTRTVEDSPRPTQSARLTAIPDVSVTPDGDVRVGLMGTF